MDEAVEELAENQNGQRQRCRRAWCPAPPEHGGPGKCQGQTDEAGFHRDLEGEIMGVEAGAVHHPGSDLGLKDVRTDAGQGVFGNFGRGLTPEFGPQRKCMSLVAQFPSPALEFRFKSGNVHLPQTCLK